MKTFFTSIMLLLLLACQQVLAAVVVVEGRSVGIADSGKAREAAIDDAMRKALLSTGSMVESDTRVMDGRVAQDSVRIRAKADVASLNILEEGFDGNSYRILAEVNLRDAYYCDADSGAAPQYARSVSVMPFVRAVPESSNVGALHNIDAEFSPELSSRLRANPGVIVVPAEDAQAAGTQLVVSGEIGDLSMVHPARYAQQDVFSRVLEATRTTMGKLRNKPVDDKRARNAAFRIRVHEGVTGALVFEKQYQSVALWDAQYGEQVKFATPRFWSTGYGREVDQLMVLAARDIGQVMKCQPFFGHLKYSQLKGLVHLGYGSTAGFKVGDTLEVYVVKSLQFPQEQAVAQGRAVMPQPKEFTKVEGVLTIDQVYPDYSLGRFNADLSETSAYYAVIR